MLFGSFSEKKESCPTCETSDINQCIFYQVGFDYVIMVLIDALLGQNHNEWLSSFCDLVKCTNDGFPPLPRDLTIIHLLS